MELYDITGSTVDHEHVYDTPHVCTHKTYKNLEIDTIAEDMTDPSMVSDYPTRNVDKADVSKHEVDKAAFRKLQIAFIIVCSVLLTIVIISSMTIGVLIHKLVSLNPSHYNNTPIHTSIL